MPKDPGQLFDPARAGCPAGEALLPAPRGIEAGVHTVRSGEQLRAVISQQQLILSRDLDGELLDGMMSISYLLLELQATITATLRTHIDKAVVFVQYVCQVDSDNKPITSLRLESLMGATRAEKQAFLARPRETRQWFALRPIELTEAPTYNFLTAKIRQHLPTLYRQMVECPNGHEQPGVALQRLLETREAEAAAS